MVIGEQVALSSLTCRLQAYKNVLALICPSKIPNKLIHGVSGVPISFAVSDPYLSRVSKFGLLEAYSIRCLKNLTVNNRAGAILLTNHPDDHTAETLESRWSSIKLMLETAELAEFGTSASPDLRHILLSQYIANGQPISSSSAVEIAEVDGWRAVRGSASAPGAGAAAVQLQAWIDHACGGWANSFG